MIKGSRVESGVYFFKIQGDGFDQTRKITSLKIVLRMIINKIKLTNS